jgi:hypothetical protein
MNRLGVVGGSRKLDPEDEYGWWEQFFIQQKLRIAGGENLLMTCVGVGSVFGNMFGDCGGEIAISFRFPAFRLFTMELLPSRRSRPLQQASPHDQMQGYRLQ